MLIVIGLTGGFKILFVVSIVCAIFIAEEELGCFECNNG